MSRIRPIIKYHGGKGLLQSWIRSKFPKDFSAFVEPFGGAGNVVLNMPPTQVEVYSDLDPVLCNLFNIVKNNCLEFCKKTEPIECKEEVFLYYKDLLASEKFQKINALEQAVTYFVVKRMSKGGIGKQFSSSKRIYSLGPENLQNWTTAKQSIPAISNRLQSIQILNKNAIDVIREFDSSGTLFYLDPPYFPSSRIAKKVYNYEMTEEEHEDLYRLVTSLNGIVAISGYHCKQYDKWYDSWALHERSVGNNSNQTMKSQGSRKIECLWINTPYAF